MKLMFHPNLGQRAVHTDEDEQRALSQGFSADPHDAIRSLGNGDRLSAHQVSNHDQEPAEAEKAPVADPPKGEGPVTPPAPQPAAPVVLPPAPFPPPAELLDTKE